MTTSAGTEAVSRTDWRGIRWALMPVALLTASVTGLSVMASIAVHDPGFALESNYYEKAVHWDNTRAEWAENSRLGWKLTLEVVPNTNKAELIATVRTADGSLLSGANVKVEAFANARAARTYDMSLAESALGTYRGVIPSPRPGLWEFRFSVEHSGERFSETTRADIRAPGANR